MATSQHQEKQQDISDELQSPEVRCWVDQHIAQPIELKGLLQDRPDDELGSLKRKLKFLQSKVVSVGGQFWVKTPNSPVWKLRSRRGEATSVIREYWGGDKTSLNLSTETFEKFFRENQYFTLDQAVCVPCAGDFVKVGGNRCLNIGSYPPIQYRESDMLSLGFESMMFMIDRAVLGNPDRSLDDILEEAFSDQKNTHNLGVPMVSVFVSKTWKTHRYRSLDRWTSSRNGQRHSC